MNSPTELGQRADLRDYLAAERTLLAWIRTGLALMGFGFVAARFGLFLQQIQIVQYAPAVRSCGLSLWFGTLLIAAGVAAKYRSGGNAVGKRWRVAPALGFQFLCPWRD